MSDMDKLREEILIKTRGSCAYCGKELFNKAWHLAEIETDIEELLQYLDIEDQEKVLNAYLTLLLAITESNVVFLIDKLGKKNGE